MKNIHLFFVGILCLSCLTSCEDVLNRTPIDKINSGDVFNDEVLTDAYLTYLYQSLHINDFLEQAANYTDEVTSAVENTNAVTLGTVSRTSEAFPYWEYEYIRNLNSFIENVGSSPFDEAVKTQFEGEARFLRAYVYFEMEKRYGGVPLVDVVLDPFHEIDQKYAARGTEEAIVDFIDSELSEISGMLSADPLPKGRVNKWTACALHARSMLWAASIAKYGTVQLNGLVGIPASRMNEFYRKAADAADAVIQSGNYALFNSIPDDKAENYRKIFMEEGNSEVIFEIVYDGVEKGHGWDASVAPYTFGTHVTQYSPTLEFVLGYENIDGSVDQPQFGVDFLYSDGADPFKNKDPRLLGSVFFEGDAWRSYTIATYEGIDTNDVPDENHIVSNPSFVYKGMNSVGNDSRMYLYDEKSPNAGFLVEKYLDDKDEKITSGRSQTNWIEFRLAEMYLTKAEALFELGEYEEAADALNQTRARAGISLVDEASITIDKVRNERRSELFLENNRFWDLRRWRIAESVLNHQFMGLRIIYHYASGKYYFLPINCETFTRIFRTEHYYNPITESRIDNNQSLIENPLY